MTKKEATESHVKYLMDVWTDMGKPALRTVCECAVGPGAQVSAFKKFAKKSLLIEPDPDMARDASTNYPWAEVVQVAIASDYGKANLRKMRGQSYIKGIKWAPAFSTPASQHRLKTAGKVPVETVPFSAVDDGEIDLINIDCEGSEWFVLETMLSRPLLLQIEFYENHGYYREITDWLAENNYRPVKYWGNSNVIYVNANLTEYDTEVVTSET